MPHEFLATWRTYEGRTAPFVLPGDEIVLSDTNGSGSTSATRLDQYISSPAFGNAEDHSLHLGLCPLPFIGNPTKAVVFILMLNPGFAPTDYFAEEQQQFRRERWANLKGESDFIGLDPRFAWTSGFAYWHGKFAPIVRAVCKRRSIAYQEALRHVAASICVLELIPYHSSSFGLADRVVAKMESPKLVKRFVHEEVLPRARQNEVLVVVTRQAKRWGVNPGVGTIVYEGNHTRAAHLGESSPAGPMILDVLARGAA